MNNCSCIIPFYNELDRIQVVIEALQFCHEIDEIICVDDASTDGAGEIIEQKYPHVILRRLPFHQGKSEAVQYGLENVSSKIVLLMDADLDDIETEVIDHVLRVMNRDTTLDMVVMQMKKFDMTSRLTRGDFIFSGVRVVRTDMLQSFFSENEVHGYELEIMMNQYAMDRQWMVVSQPFDAYCYPPVKKLGFMTIVVRDVQRYPHLISKVGLRKYIDQLRTFGRQSLEDYLQEKPRESPAVSLVRDEDG